MQILFACGNPGAKYNFTRHNFGFLALDFYAKVHQLEWKEKSKFKAILAEDSEHNRILVKPQTFYNEVGQSLQAILAYYKLQPSDVLVICDDFNLNFGTLRFREHGSAGGNNGLKSVIQYLGSEDFPRLRLGSANNELRKRIGDVDFVLSKFTNEEQEKLSTILTDFCNFIAKY